MDPKISIIVPVYKVEPYIHKCIDSILNQTFKDFELILVDDGSPDRCGEICDEYAKKDNRIVVIHKENKGVSSARNTGIQIAKGEYIAFVDPDDYIDKNMYEKLLLMAKTNNLDITVCQIKTVNNILGIKKVTEIYDNEVLNKKSIDDELMPSILHGKDYGTFSSVNKLYKKDIFKKYGVLFDETRDHGEDARLNLTLLSKIDRIGFIKEALYIYQIYERGSLTQKFRENLFYYIKDNLHFGVTLCNKYKVYDAIKLIEENFIINSVNFLQDISVSKVENKKNKILIILNDNDFKKIINKYEAPSIYLKLIKNICKSSKPTILIFLVNIKNKIQYKNLFTRGNN